MPTTLDQLPELKRGILSLLKKYGSAFMDDLSRELAVSREGVRQPLIQMKKEGWIREEVERLPKSGRPAHRYRLTVAGEHLFPKAYDALTVEFIDRLTECLGQKALREVLTLMTETRVRQWAPKLEGKTLEEKLEALKDVYFDSDPFMSVERENKEIFLVEKNCPFMNVASKKPALCSVTVSTLSRLLGYRVERVQSFQAGHGRCMFRLRRDQPINLKSFFFEFEKPELLRG